MEEGYMAFLGHGWSCYQWLGNQNPVQLLSEQVLEWWGEEFVKDRKSSDSPCFGLLLSLPCSTGAFLCPLFVCFLCNSLSPLPLVCFRHALSSLCCLLASICSLLSIFRAFIFLSSSLSCWVHVVKAGTQLGYCFSQHLLIEGRNNAFNNYW